MNNFRVRVAKAVMLLEACSNSLKPFSRFNGGEYVRLVIFHHELPVCPRESVEDLVI